MPELMHIEVDVRIEPGRSLTVETPDGVVMISALIPGMTQVTTYEVGSAPSACVMFGERMHSQDPADRVLTRMREEPRI